MPEVKQYTKKQKLAILRKWVKALRSGKYQQARMCLRRQEVGKKPSYCCLGVLCQVKGLRRDGGVYKFGKNASRTELPDSFADKLGIAPNVESTLVNMNDSKGLTFEQIADYVSENIIKPLAGK